VKGMFRRTKLGVRRAVAYDEIKDNTRYIFRVVKGFARVGGKRTQGYQSFEDMPYSEVEIQTSRENFKKLAITYFAIFILSLLYILYNLINHNTVTAILSVCFSLACLSMAFRYHFWVFQIKVRRLGCSFKDYFHYLLGKEA